MANDQKSRFEQKLALQRWSLWAEFFWHHIQAPLWLTVFALTLIFSGVLLSIPDGLRLMILAALTVGFLWSLTGLFKFKTQSRHDALRRMETSVGLNHRALSSLEDNLPDEQPNPETKAIWHAHRQRLEAKASVAPISWPQSAWRKFDANALRVPLALAFMASLFLGPAGVASNLQQSLALGGSPMAATTSIDAWLKPPSYTGKPPVLMTSAAMREKLSDGSEILVPENSVLSLRITAATKPRLEFFALGDDASTLQSISDIKATTSNAAAGFVATATLSRPTLIKAFDGDTEIAAWPVSLIPDIPPSIAIVKDPSQESLGTLVMDWQAQDDYGLKSITAEISLADEQKDGPGFASNGVFLFDPPEFPITLKRLRAKSETATSKADLASHPWAGLRVDITLTATDEAGKTGTTIRQGVILPERNFFKPLAKALVEQRKSLILSPERVNEVVNLLQTIAAYPDGLFDRSGQFINFSTTVSKLTNYRNHDDVKEVIADLWTLALDIEEGGLADARAELQALKKELERAIAEGASPERIAELMDKMRKAMDRYMEAMREEGKKRQSADNAQKPPDQNGKSITEQELQKMLETIEKLAQSGAKDAAQELLAQLDQLLQNLEPGQQSNQNAQSDQETSEMLDALSDLMKRQQDLMGDTQREPQSGEGSQSDRNEGQAGRSGEQTGEGLAGEQQALRDKLERMMRQLGGDSPNAFGEAGRRMGEAEQSLRDENREQALGEQGKALENLRSGAQKLARQAQRSRGQGQARNHGRDGEANGDDVDPLGRPKASNTPEYGPKDDMVPSELAIRRAQEILQQLRSKANDNGLSKPELDYIERLLRGIY